MSLEITAKYCSPEELYKEFGMDREQEIIDALAKELKNDKELKKLIEEEIKIERGDYAIKSRFEILDL